MLVLGASTAWAERTIPPLSGPVVDEAGLLGPADRERLEQLAFLARAENGGRGVQLQYFIVPDLEGEPIESLSIRAAEAWKLGSREEDNGLLFVVARDDRRMRIEVGGGLEGALTDAQSSRIIRNTLTPAFRAGRFGEGLYEGGVEALAAVGGLPRGLTLPPQPATTGRRKAPAGNTCSTGMFVLMGLFWLLLRIIGGPSRRRRSAWWGPVLVGGLGGGRFGGGGSGGRRSGGWGGGGGGFSGGGSSGSW